MKDSTSPFTIHTASTLLCPLLFLGLIAQSAELARAQQVETVTVKKVIAEPVHRVPKIASMANLPNSTEASEPRAADALASAVPAMLPSATSVISLPATELAAASIASNPQPSIEPVAATMKTTPALAPAAPHPLDNALETAEKGLENIRATIKDYSAILVKRERIDGELMKPEYMQLKVRRGGIDDEGQQVPFSIYMKFIKPRASAGRELIWVKGKNDGKLCVHEGSGIIALKRFNLDPDGWLAMKGQRYPIYEAGIENLVVKLIEKASRDRAAGDCEVVNRTGVKINGRSCSVIEVTHPEQREPYDFHIAKVFIDDEMQLPVRYEAHLWPEGESAKPLLLEEYTYLNMKVNQGFTDEDFCPDNPAYKFPGR